MQMLCQFEAKNLVSQHSFLSENLKSCRDWLIDNKLSLHLGKTETILFGTKRKLKHITNFLVKCDDIILTNVRRIKGTVPRIMLDLATLIILNQDLWIYGFPRSGFGSDLVRTLVGGRISHKKLEGLPVRAFFAIFSPCQNSIIFSEYYCEKTRKKCLKKHHGRGVRNCFMNKSQKCEHLSVTDVPVPLKTNIFCTP